MLYHSEETFSLESNLNSYHESFSNASYQDYKNIITNGDFSDGKDVGGYSDQSGINKIVEKTNPSSSKYVLQQEDSTDTTFYEIIQPVLPNTLYLFRMWVLLEEPISENPDYSKLFRVRILGSDGANQLPPIRYQLERTSTLQSNEKWVLLNYRFSSSNSVKEHMNLYINYASQLIAKKIYYANLQLSKLLYDVPDFIYTNGLTAFISGFYADNGSLSVRDLSTLQNNFILKNRAVVNGSNGSIDLYNNIASQSNGSVLFGTSPMFMINLLLSVPKSESKESEEEEEDDEKVICGIYDSNGRSTLSLKVDSQKKIRLQCNEISSVTNVPILLQDKTLLSIGFNNQLHTLIFYQDTKPILRIENCPTLSFEKSSFIINTNQYLHLTLYDCIIHNYVLLEKELTDLRSYLFESSKRMPTNKPSLFDYIIPKSWSNNGEKSGTDENDDFYLSFTKVKKEVCDEKSEVKPSDCPSAYKKGDDYYIYIPQNSYYHNKLGYYGEKLYGSDKGKVKYIYELNFPECELPVILTESEGGKFSNTCPFIIEKNNPCGMVGCGGVNWNQKYVEDLGLNDKCKKAVSYYCRVNYDLDPKCAAWKPENKNHMPSVHVRNYFESPNEYCDISRYKIEEHPDFKNYIRKDKIPCWGCKIE